jgi:hypothetical protein
MVNLFCDSCLKPEDIYPVKEYADEWIIARSAWDALRYILSGGINNLSLPIEFAPDMQGDIYYGEALLHTILNTRNYPSGRISFHGKGIVVSYESTVLLREIDTARAKRAQLIP